MRSKLSLLLGLILISGMVQAKSINTYSVEVKPKTKLVRDGTVADILGALSGYECSQRATATFRSTQKDHRGREIPIVRESAGDYRGETLFDGDAGIKMTIDQNLANTNPNLTVELTEKCVRTYEREERVQITIDENGDEVEDGDTVTGRTYQTYKERLIQYQNVLVTEWRCKISDFPRYEGDKSRYTCEQSSTDTYKLRQGLRIKESRGERIDNRIIGLLRDKVIVTDITLKQKREEFIQLNDMNEDLGMTEMFIFNVSQGIAYRGTIYVSVNDGERYKVETNSKGLIQEDFIYYAKEGSEKINVKISAEGYNNNPGIDLYQISSRERTISLNQNGLLGRGSYSETAVRLLNSNLLKITYDGEKVELTEDAKAQVEKMKEDIEDQMSLVRTNVSSIDELTDALYSAETNYGLSVGLTIISVIGGGAMIIIGGQKILMKKQQVGSLLKAISPKAAALVLGGIGVMAGSGVVLKLSADACDRAIGKLMDMRVEYEDALSMLEQKNVKLVKLLYLSE